MSQWPSDYEYTIPVTPGPDVVTVTIDGNEVQAARGALLIDVAQRHGTYIPRFCYHERMRPVGMCRMCLVEVDGMRGLQISCATPVGDGMVVRTASDAVKSAQDGVLELLLINHPLDCPVCDRGGECPLQDQTLAFGPGESRFVEEKRHFEKPIPVSDLVLLDRERCIQCGRCTRFAAEIAGDPLIDFGGRGGDTEVIAFPDEPFSSYFSGNTVQICPVGALTARPYRFKARPWDLEAVETSCQACAVGCRGSLESTTNRLVRFLGVDSEPVNHGWLCDKGRFGYEWVHSDARLRVPVVRHGEELSDVSWPVALEAAASGLRRVLDQHGPSALAVLGGARGTNEDAYAWARFAKGVLRTDNVDAQLGDGLPAEVVLGLPRATIADLDRAAAIVLLGPDLEEELPILSLRVRRAVVELGVPLVEVGPRATRLSGDATAIVRHLPGEPAAAAEGLAAVLTGRKGRTKALTALGAALEGRDGPIVVVLGRSSVAEHPDGTVHAASVLARVERVRFLSALRRGNVHGALDLGLAPGFLPGRVTLEAGREHFVDAWGGVPETTGRDATGILHAAAEGDIHALVLVGCDPIVDFPDRTLARAALENVDFIVSVGRFRDDAAERANVVLPSTVWGEQSGTTTNLEGRVLRLARKVTAEGVAMEPWRIAAELAARFGSIFGPSSVEEMQDEIAEVAPAFAGVDSSILRRARDGVVLPAASHAEEVVFGVGAGGVGAGVSWEPIPPSPADSSDGDVPSFPTPAVALHVWRPLAAPAPLIATDAYALRLVASRTLYGAERVVESSRFLAAMIPAARLAVSPRDRDRIGVGDGTLVRITTGRGTIELPLHGDPGVPEGVAWSAINHTGPGIADLIDALEPVTDLRVETL